MFALGAVVPIDLHALAASTLGAYAVIAVIEGVITALIVRALLGVRPDLVRVAEPLRRRRQAHALPRAGTSPAPRPPPPRVRGAPKGGPRGLTGHVWFVGAGPGAPDLLTLRAVARRSARPTSSCGRAALVDEAILEHARAGAELIASDDRTHDDVRRDLRARGGGRPAASPACTPATRRSTARCTSRSRPAGALGLELRDRPRRQRAGGRGGRARAGADRSPTSRRR